MRFFIILLMFLPLFGSSLSQMIEKAKSYEEEGDLKNALHWYKKAALKNESNSSLVETLKEKNSEYVIKELDEHSKAEIYASYLEPYDDKESDETIFQILSGSFGLKPYKSNYIMPITYDARKSEDRKSSETKFQLSIQKEIFYDLFGLNESLHFAYTQRSWWQIFEHSSPFRETNYEPEAFLLLPYKERYSYLKALKFGYLHQSNGQGGELSRSWDRVYASAFFQLGGIFVSPRIWKDIGDLSDNPDIKDYVGHGDLTLFYPWKRQLLRAVFTNNFKKENRTSATLEWTFPIFNSGIFGFLQYFYGYGESMIDYDRLTKRIGLGFSISR